MEFIKLLIAFLADPISHVLMFLLLVWKLQALKKYLWLAICYLILMATPIVNISMASLWSVPDRVDTKVYDAAVLLLGVTDYKWHLNYTPDKRNGYCNLNQNSSRVGYIVKQYREGRISRILLGRNIIGDFDETDCVIDLLKQHGIHSDDITVMGNVRRTQDEIRQLKQIMKKSSLMPVLLVTSSNHMRRAIAFSVVEGMDLDHYSTSRIGIKGQFSEFMPSSKWLVKNSLLFYEILAYIWYKVTGKL